MKVLLMVQNGDGRPRCLLRSVAEHYWRRSGERLRDLYHDRALGDVRMEWMYGKWVKAFRAADRWRLVEAEHAEDARRVIRCDAGRCEHFGGDADDRAPGRILAQGGRDA